MQENEFEKRVQQKMDGFTLLPREDVWNQVETRIKKERNRKPLFIWMFAGLLLLGGAGAWWYIDNQGEPVAGSSAGRTIAHNDNATKHSNLHKTDTIRNNETTTVNKDHLDGKPPEQQTSIKSQQRHGARVSRIKNYKVANVPGIRANSYKKSLPEKRTDTYTGTQLAAHQPKKADVYKSRDRITDWARRDLPLHKHYKAPEDLIRDSIQRSLTINVKPKITPETSAVSQPAATKHKVAGTKGWKFGLSLYGGFSDNVSGIKLFGAKSLMSDAYLNSPNYSSNAGSASSPILPPLQHKSAGSFGVGAFAKRQLSKRFDLSIGIDYHYFSTASKVGTKVNVNRSFYDTATMKLASVEATYGNGQTTNFANKYHVLQVPIDVAYRLNRNVGKPITFSLGVAPAFLISSQALYLNKSANVYYEDKHQFKSFMLFGQSTIMFTAVTSSKYNITAGPVFQYGFNSFSKWQTGTNQHLIFTGIKTNIILK